MKIIKYEKKKDNKYKVYLDNGTSIILYEDTIIKNNLLFKKEIDSALLDTIMDTDNVSSLYNKCIKYLGVRIRCEKEIRDYLKRYTEDEIIIEDIISRLKKNKLLNDEEYVRAFINDKFKFSSMGPYRIINELKNNNITDDIIYKYIDQISDEDIDIKISKFIEKNLKSSKKKDNIRNKIYNNLMNNGFSGESILRNINKYNL